MQWYENIIELLDKDHIYSHKELIDLLKDENPQLAENTYQWTLNSLVRDGKILHSGYNAYSLAGDTRPAGYRPDYSDKANKLIRLIDKAYTYVRFTVFETVLLNEFLNHLISQNIIFLQVEKDSSIYIFRFLQEKGFDHVLYKPDKESFHLYWEKDSIVVTDMISEAPLRNNISHEITLEKMLVDIYADKLISSTYSKAEYPDILRQADDKYMLDKARMLRYARRRNRHDEIEQMLKRG